MELRQFVEFIARHLVDHPDQVSVEQEQKESSIIVKLKVHQEDIGKVIGRKGYTAQAMRVLLMAVAAKGGKRANLEIVS